MSVSKRDPKPVFIDLRQGFKNSQERVKLYEFLKTSLIELIKQYPNVLQDQLLNQLCLANHITREEFNFVHNIYIQNVNDHIFSYKHKKE
jgi:hypothetical protein